MLMLGLVTGAIFFRFFPGFGIGTSIADTFGTTGGDGGLIPFTTQEKFLRAPAESARTGGPADVHPSL
ncbi:hypothetical protein C5C00_08770 [Rathayibacter rathayi]|nr:hypothetical protein C5C00_08770 [Rathayibacter rathayi]